MSQLARAPTMHHEHLFQDLFQKLLSHITALCADPVHYGTLTTRLAQAVRPNASQLNIFASDKRETAGLIVDASCLPSLRWAFFCDPRLLPLRAEPYGRQ